MTAEENWKKKLLPPAHSKLYRGVGRIVKPFITPVQKGFIKNTVHNMSTIADRARHKTKDKLPLLAYARNGYTDYYRRTAIYEKNAYYGLEPALLAYSGREESIKAKIEHGLYLGIFVNSFETSQSGLPAIMTYGPVRAQRIRSFSDIPIICLGPYIQYAKPFLSDDEFITLKEKIGKTLLVFPTHSIKGMSLDLDVKSIISESESLAQRHGLQTILICLFFNEINNGLAEPFERSGHKVVSAGHRMDPDFFPRLRSLIELSDLTASNSVGTHIGYSVALERPHIVFSAPAVLEERLAEGFDWTDDLERHRATFASDRATIGHAFRENGEHKEILQVCNEYWGAGIKLSPHELSSVLSSLDRAYAVMQREKIGAREALFRVAPNIGDMIGQDI